MAHGQPDYGGQQQKTVGATLSDMAELAARLNSIVTFDRRGDAIWLEDFEGTVLSLFSQTGVGDTFTLDSASVKSDSQALKAHIVTAGAWFPYIMKARAALASRKLGFEFSFSDHPDTMTLRFHINQVRNNRRRYALLDLNFTTGTVSITTPAGVVVIAGPGLTLPSLAHLYNSVKLVADLDAQRYIRLLLANVEYDLTPYTTLDAGLVISDRDYVQIWFWLNGGSPPADIWLDDMILTMNEF